MRVVNLKLLKIKVDGFSARDDSVLLEIHFDDGSAKQIFRHSTIDDPRLSADEVIRELIRMERNINVQFDGKVLAGTVKVVVEDEEDCRHKMTSFFSELKSRIFRVRNFKSADGYLDVIRDINKMKLVF